MLAINSIELTNVCNMHCGHCPSSKSEYPRGFMSPETFAKALRHVKSGDRFNLQMFGEGLLHGELYEMLDMAKAAGALPILNTNGALLTGKIVAEAAAHGLSRMEVSVHGRKSLEGYLAGWAGLQQCPPSFSYLGNYLECYEAAIAKWLDELGADDNQRRFLYKQNTHNWAMLETRRDEEDVARLKTACMFLSGGQCVVRWDGTVTTCCFDSEGINKVGRVDDFESLSYENIETPLCATCSPAWVNMERSFS